MRLGTPVVITHKLRRERVQLPDRVTGALVRARVWSRVPVKDSATYFVVGKRIYADGTVMVSEDSVGFNATARYEVLLVCADIRRAPTAVLPGDVRPLWVSGG